MQRASIEYTVEEEPKVLDLDGRTKWQYFLMKRLSCSGGKTL